ncbi:MULTISPECIES: alpha/beta hydrolase [unclassified Rhizobium]|uniref:alpha/beta hydrolase n=1 Tax=unclassified Rhizobium TaxID=2613769 RepID=UPI000EAACBC9|nr:MULTISPECIES: alpha/beta hydrolase [unclassified Rhizobium]AYG68484.1 alpha/beta hydrolase [Rhizobium sp. CCGE531]AYG74867.1 alpha/beta hydrolase [Rhizobium sp. CCGE532]
MSYFKVTDWESAYTNGAYIVDGDRWPAAWAEPARAFREKLAAAGRVKLDLAYGPAERNRFDLFLPEGQPKGLVVFVHGGYWLQLDKSYWSHLAAGSIATGYVVAIPSYTLCPENRIGGIGREIAAAIKSAAEMVGGPIILTGHSAGGQLVARMMTVTSPLDEAIRERIRHVLAISGLHDLRPIMKRAMNEQLRIDNIEARAESPALLEPVEAVRLTCWVGGAERAEFIRQNALLANIWTGLGAATEVVVEPDKHHYSVLDGLIDAGHPLTRTLLAE